MMKTVQIMIQQKAATHSKTSKQHQIYSTAYHFGDPSLSTSTTVRECIPDMIFGTPEEANEDNKDTSMFRPSLSQKPFVWHSSGSSLRVAIPDSLKKTAEAANAVIKWTVKRSIRIDLGVLMLKLFDLSHGCDATKSSLTISHTLLLSWSMCCTWSWSAPVICRCRIPSISVCLSLLLVHGQPDRFRLPCASRLHGMQTVAG